MNIHWTNLCRGLLLPALVTFCGCNMGGDRVTAGEMRKESKTVALGAAHTVKVSLSMKAGELKIGGGATDLMDGGLYVRRAGMEAGSEL